jgi:hypothetical protein
MTPSVGNRGFSKSVVGGTATSSLNGDVATSAVVGQSSMIEKEKRVLEKIKARQRKEIE